MEKEMIEMINEDELLEIAGGRVARNRTRSNNAASTEMCKCEQCGIDTPHICYTGTRAVCTVCGAEATV